MPSIAEFMSQDHDRLDTIFADLQKESDHEKAEDLFLQFESGLLAHIVWEEEILFPAFEEKTGMRDSGPTCIMRMEHQQIRQLLQTMGERIASPDAGELAEELVEVLAAHNQKEEDVLYPSLDQVVPEEERSALLDRIKG